MNLEFRKIMFLDDCADGSAKLGVDGTPFLLKGGNWSPICGHYFWDKNSDGAKAFCQELGYASGYLEIAYSAYNVDAIEIGFCKSGETIDSCTGGNNYYENTSRCQTGKYVAITISCTGHTPGTEKKSCRGKIKDLAFINTVN